MERRVVSVLPCLIFINDLSDSESYSQSADDSHLCRDIPHPSGSQAAVSSLSSDLDKSTRCSNTWNRSFNLDIHLHIISIFLRKDRMQTLPSTFSKILSNKLNHSNYWVPLATKQYFKVGLQNRSQSGIPPSCKVFPWKT